MGGGQAMDLAAEGQFLDLQAITRLQQLKTGALLGAAVEMGAILGRLPPEGRAHLRGYARDIGLAFQIADDLIDHEGDASVAGKAVGKDAEAGKETFVSLLGPDRARDQARMLELAPFIAALAGADPQDPDAAALRWELEELRVQLFAQELGVRGNVSPKKLAQRTAALRRAAVT